MSKVEKKYNQDTAEMFISINANAEQWQKAQEDAIKELAKKLEIKGFRKGKIPLKIAKQNISQADIFSKAIGLILEKLAEESSKKIEKNQIVLAPPTYAIKKITEEILEVQFIYPIFPEFKMANYKNMSIDYATKKINSQEINQEIKNIQQKSVKKITKKNNVIAKGDIVIFDFEGFVDKKPFEGGKAKDYELEIGSNRFIPGFEEKMIGLKNNQETTIEVVFPKNYHEVKLQNKKAQFKIKINKIQTAQLPTLDDAFVKNLNINGVNSVANLKKYFQNILEENSIQKARQEFKDKILEKIKAKMQIPVSPLIIAEESKKILDNLKKQLESNHIDLDKYLELRKMDLKKLEAENKISAKNRIQDSIIFAKIAQLEKIQLNDQDYENEYKKYAKIYNQDLKNIKTLITKEQMQVPMTNDKVLDLLIKHNKK